VTPGFWTVPNVFAPLREAPIGKLKLRHSYDGLGNKEKCIGRDLSYVEREPSYMYVIARRRGHIRFAVPKSLIRPPGSNRRFSGRSDSHWRYGATTASTLLPTLDCLLERQAFAQRATRFQHPPHFARRGERVGNRHTNRSANDLNVDATGDHDAWRIAQPFKSFLKKRVAAFALCWLWTSMSGTLPS
jgi:hypothetical protein